MRLHFAFAPARRLGVVLLFLGTGWGLAGASRAEEPKKTSRLTAEQQKQLQQAKAHGEQARKQFEQGKHVEAIQRWQKKVALERAVWGTAHAQLVPSLQTLATWQEAVEDFAGAEKARQEVLAIQTRLLGDRHWRVADARLALADTRRLARLDRDQRQRLAKARQWNSEVFRLARQGKLSEALALALRALQVRKELLGEEHPDYAESLNTLALQHQTLGDYARAETLLNSTAAV
jgi:tetratricopeptide (TPR) repeat protein